MARCKRCNAFMLTASDTGYCKKCNAEVLRGMMEKEAKGKSYSQNNQRTYAQLKPLTPNQPSSNPVKQQAIDEMKKVAAENMFAMPNLYSDPLSAMNSRMGRNDGILSDQEIAYLGLPAAIVELQAMNGATVLLHNNTVHAEAVALLSDIEAAYVRGSVIKALGITSGDKVMLTVVNTGNVVKQSSAPPVKKSLYPHIEEMKKMFAVFMPRYQASVFLDDNAWQVPVSDNAFWANQALEYKRDGQYVEACKLYFKYILEINAITSGWAKGIFKTLASAGDFADALTFGLDWFRMIGPGVDPRQDQLCTQYITLMTFLKHPDENPSLLKQYLQSISGNSSYEIDLNQTDIYSNEVKEHVKQYD